MLRLAVIIPVHQGGEAFNRCLDAIVASERAPDEFFVVADGPVDESWRVAEEVGATILVNERAMGPAFARNRAAAAATSELLFFVDSDVEIQPDTLSRVVSMFEGDGKFEAAIGSYDDAPSETAWISSFRNLLHHYTHQHSGTETFTFWGACGAIRRDVFEQIGGFDAAYTKPSIEDIELGYRLSSAGYRIRLEPSLHVKHLKRWTAWSMITTDIFQRAIPWTELLLDRKRTERNLNLSGSNRFSVVLVFAMLFLCFGGLTLPTSMLPLPALVAGLVMLSAVFITINRDFYCFLWRTRGMLFMLASIPLHALHFAYSGLAYTFAVARFRWRRFTR
jgi:GT2 family glycosyltransferase